MGLNRVAIGDVCRTMTPRVARASRLRGAP